MSSFDYTDNFSGFNDLINRVEFLQEKDWKSMVGSAKLRPEFAKYEAEDPKTGDKAPPGGLSRLANILFVTALGEAHLGIIDSKTSAILRKPPYATSSTKIPQALKELEPKAFEELFREKNPRSVEVSEYVKNPEKLEELIKDTVINFTRADREYVKKVDSEDLADAVGDAVDDIEDAADDMESRFEKGVLGAVGSEADLKARISELDFDDVDVSLEELENKDEIAAKIVELINTTDNLTAEVTPIGFNIEGPVGVFVDSDTITDQMNRLITKYFPNVGGRDIPVRLNTSVGEEDYEQIDDEEYEGPSMANNPGGAPSSYAQGEEGGGLTTPEDAEDELDHFLTKEQPEDNIPATDYEDVVAALVDDDKKKHAIKRLYGNDDDPGHIDDMRAEYPPDPFGGGYEDEEKDLSKWDEEGNLIRGSKGEALAPVRSSGFFDDPKRDVLQQAHRPPGWVAWKEEQKRKKEKRLREDEEEDFNYSPMLDSYKTSTAGYLTEQAALDKRNKKTEVKPQSFKEKYKPKTHWQLQELRRYGL